MDTVTSVNYIENYQLEISFADGYTGIIDIKPFIVKGISIKLLDINYFKTVKVDDFGGIAWENGFDFCPVFIRQQVDKKQIAQITA